MKNANTPKPPKDVNEVLQRHGWDETRRQIDHNRSTLDEVLEVHPEIADKLANDNRAGTNQTAGTDGIGYVTAANPEPEGKPWPEVYRASVFAGKQIPEREWTWGGLYPKGQPGLLTSAGANGKTTLLMQLGGALAANRSKFLERKIDPGPALLVLVEDDDKEILRRLEAIRIDMGLSSFNELSELHILNLCGCRATLWMGAGQGNHVTGTPGWAKVRSLVKSICPKLVGLDPKANLFLGQELDRGQATTVVNDFLRGEICMENDSTVILCEHPSQAGAANRTGDFGSGGWTNSMRSRQFFERVKNSDGDEEDTDLRTLTSNKPNYGAKEIMRLRWHMTLKDRGKETGVFRLDGPVVASAEDHAARIDEIVLEIMKRFTEQNRDLSPAKNSSHYFVMAMKRREETRGIAPKDLEKAMERLLDSGKVRLVTHGKGGKATKRLVAFGGIE